MTSPLIGVNFGNNIDHCHEVNKGECLVYGCLCSTYLNEINKSECLVHGRFCSTNVYAVLKKKNCAEPKFMWLS